MGSVLLVSSNAIGFMSIFNKNDFRLQCEGYWILDIFSESCTYVPIWIPETDPVGVPGGAVPSAHRLNRDRF